MTNLDSVLKSRDITLLIKACIVKAMVFPVVMYRSESRTIKKAKCLRIDAFKLCCWRRLLRVPWTARRSNQSILKEIKFEYSLEGLMLKPRDVKSWLTGCHQYPDAGKDWEKRETEDEMVGWHHWLNGQEFEHTQGDSEGQGSLVCCTPSGGKELDMTYQLNNTNLHNIPVAVPWWKGKIWSRNQYLKK